MVIHFRTRSRGAFKLSQSQRGHALQILTTNNKHLYLPWSQSRVKGFTSFSKYVQRGFAVFRGPIGTGTPARPSVDLTAVDINKGPSRSFEHYNHITPTHSFPHSPTHPLRTTIHRLAFLLGEIASLGSVTTQLSRTKKSYNCWSLGVSRVTTRRMPSIVKRPFLYASRTHASLAAR